MEVEQDMDVCKAYVAFMNEYELAGNMFVVPFQLLDKLPNYYIPHPAILKPDSSTIKLRMVFNA